MWLVGGCFLLLIAPVHSQNEDDGVWKELSFSFRADSNGTIKSGHIQWTDRYDDSFAYAFTNENDTNLEFMHDKPRPQLFVSDDFMVDAFSEFVELFQNRSRIDSVQITMPALTDDLKSAVQLDNRWATKPSVGAFQFNSYDTQLYTEFLALSSGIPKRIKISFFSFMERTDKVWNGTVLYHPKIRKVDELDVRTVESDVNDEQLQQLECQSISVRSSTVTNSGINLILKEWQDGLRTTRYLKVVGDDLQKAEIMDGVLKRTLQRSVWEVNNRFNVSATVTFSRVPTNLYDSKPTFEFSVA